MQLKSSLISFNHYFDSPVIPTKRRIQAAGNSSLDSLFFCDFLIAASLIRHVPDTLWISSLAAMR